MTSFFSGCNPLTEPQTSFEFNASDCLGEAAQLNGQDH